MAAYPGQRHRRAPAVVVLALLVALGVGVAIGWAAFGRDTTATKAQVPPCPGSQYDTLERAHAAACLLDNFLALGTQPEAVRNRELATIVLPTMLEQFRKGYRPVGAEYPRGTTVYAAVGAVKLYQGDPAYQAPDVAYRAWVAIAANTTPPRSKAYIGDFAVRWQGDRWWLTGAFGYNSTVPSSVLDTDDAPLGPGWVGV